MVCTCENRQFRWEYSIHLCVLTCPAAVCPCMLSPGGMRCRSRPRASSICPERRTQPHPLSVVRELRASWGKPRLYVNHRSDAKEQRKRSLCPGTVTELESKFPLDFRTTRKRSFQEVWGPDLDHWAHRIGQAWSAESSCGTWISASRTSLKHKREQRVLSPKTNKENNQVCSYYTVTTTVTMSECCNRPYLTLFHAETNLDLSLPLSSASWSSLLTSRRWGPADSVERKSQSSIRSSAGDWPSQCAEELLGFITGDDQDSV